MLPGEACVEFARRLVLEAVAQPEAQTLRVDAAEFVDIARVERRRHAVLVRPEVACIGVDGRVFLDGEGLACAEVRAVIGVRAVVARRRAAEVGAVVALGAACTQRSFEPEPVVLRELAEDARADVADFAAAVRAVVEVGVVGAAAVFDEGAEENLRAVFLNIFTRPADTEPFHEILRKLTSEVEAALA